MNAEGESPSLETEHAITAKDPFSRPDPPVDVVIDVSRLLFLLPNTPEANRVKSSDFRITITNRRPCLGLLENPMEPISQVTLWRCR